MAEPKKEHIAIPPYKDEDDKSGIFIKVKGRPEVIQRVPNPEGHYRHEHYNNDHYKTDALITPGVGTQYWRTEQAFDAGTYSDHTTMANFIAQSLSTNMNLTASSGNSFSSGRWHTDFDTSTPSVSTGPSPGNSRPFLFYEVSNSGGQNSAARSLFTIDGGSGRSLEVINWLQSSNQRRLIVDVCLQGSGWNTPLALLNRLPALFLWSSDSAPNFSPNLATNERLVRNLYQGRSHGWEYSSSGFLRQVGATLRDFGEEEFQIIYNGGWRRVIFDVPNNHQYIGLTVDIDNTNFRTDACITSIELQEYK